MQKETIDQLKKIVKELQNEITKTELLKGDKTVITAANGRVSGLEFCITMILDLIEGAKS